MKNNKTISMIIAGIISIAFIGAGISKIMGVEMQIKNLESWGFPLWLRFPIGLGEIILAAGLWIPRLKYTTILAIYVWGIIAIITHAQATPPQYEMVGGPVLFLVLNFIYSRLIRKITLTNS